MQCHLQGFHKNAVSHQGCTINNSILMCYYTTYYMPFIFKVHLENLEFFSLINIPMKGSIHPVFNLKCVQVAENMEQLNYTGISFWTLISTDKLIQSLQVLLAHYFSLHNSQSSCHSVPALHSVETSGCTSQQSSRDLAPERRHSVNSCSLQGHQG